MSKCVKKVNSQNEDEKNDCAENFGKEKHKRIERFKKKSL